MQNINVLFHSLQVYSLLDDFAVIVANITGGGVKDRKHVSLEYADCNL